ncbi:MAG: hypothetical protein ABIA59_04170 [Candidatus Latescibacterota bacterium]
MRLLSYSGLAVLFALLLSCPSITCAQVITNITIGEFTFSPDGDGMQDSTNITVTFPDSVDSFDAFVLSGDTLTIVDILVSGEARSSGTDTIWWNGKNFFGNVVPEGNYLVFIRAANASGSDSVYKEIFVDLTKPDVSITQIEPSSLIAPGLPGAQALRIDYFISDSFPSDSIDVSVIIVNPSGSTLETLTSLQLQVGREYRAEWDGAKAAKDGIHEVRIRVQDNGGHSRSASAPINVDLNKPSLQISSPMNNKTFNVIPDNLTGWAYDRNGVTPVQIAYSVERHYAPVPNQWTLHDTLFFSAPLADSITQTAEYQLWFKTADTAGRQDSISFNIEWDTSSPASPQLDAPQAVVHIPSYILTGTFSQDTKKVRIFRDGAFIDSVVIVIQTSLSKEVRLQPGDNVFTAVALDDAGNVSAPSEAVTVVYDSATSVFIPQPFRPDDSFQINLTGEKARIALRIFDLAGNLVFVQREYTFGSSIDMHWNGLNGDAETVKRGPLVMVVSVSYDNGDKNTLREIFLFQP